MNYVADEHGFRVAATNLPKSPAPIQAAAPVVPQVYAPVPAPVAPVVAAEVPAAVEPLGGIDLRGEVFGTEDIAVVAAAPQVAAAPIAYVTHPVAHHDITLFNPFDTFAKSAVEHSDAEITPIVAAAPVAYSAIPVPAAPVQTAVPATYAAPVQAAVPSPYAYAHHAAPAYAPSPYAYAHQAAPVYTTNYVPATVPVTAPVAPVAPLGSSQFHAQVIIII